MIDSKHFYHTIELAMLDAQRQIAAAGYKGQVGISIFAGQRFSVKNNFDINIDGGDYGAELKVKGKDLQQCVEEFIRRAGFDKGQQTLALGGPIVEHQP